MAKKIEKKKRLCGIYARVSTDRQAAIKDGGLDTQLASAENFVRNVLPQRHNDVEWALVDTYREEGWSGKNLERPEFRRLKQDIKEGRINTVVVFKIDRITRSLSDFTDLWKFFEEYGVEFVSINENFDTSDAMGEAMLAIIMVFAQLERRMTAERTEATMRHRASQGLWNGGQRPLGYDVDANKKGVLIPNEEEARLVNEHFFRKYLELGSSGAVVRHLQAAGIRKPVYTSRRGKPKGGNFYVKQEVVRILTAPVYIGKIRYHDELFQGKHPGIVAPEVFAEVERVLTKNRETNSNSLDQGSHTYLLQGLIRCGKCGSMMTPKWSTANGKRHYYYQCTKEAHSAGTTCNAKYVPAEAAEQFVLAELRNLSLSESEIQEVVRLTNDRKDETLVNLEAEEKSLRGRIREAKNKIGKLVQALETGGEIQSLTSRIKELEDEQRSMEDELRYVQQEAEIIRKQVLSSQVMAETYRGFPEMLDRLIQGEQWQVIKNMLTRYVEVIDWHMEPDDPSTGTVEIMLYQQPCEAGQSRKNETLDAQAVNALCDEGYERLPD